VTAATALHAAQRPLPAPPNNRAVGLALRRGGNLIGKAAFAQIEFATASPLERDGFETSVPGERAYGLNLCLSPYELPFSARSCSAWSARTR
jgi:hypothetical protein